MLDDDYPRNINVGFDTIPDHVDAAFALPAPGHNGKEKVYFFKGTKTWPNIARCYNPVFGVEFAMRRPSLE